MLSLAAINLVVKMVLSKLNYINETDNIFIERHYNNREFSKYWTSILVAKKNGKYSGFSKSRFPQIFNPASFPSRWGLIPSLP